LTSSRTLGALLAAWVATAPAFGEPQAEAQPAEPREVRIAWFGPSDPGDPLGGDPWLAAGLALDEANREGGYSGAPFRLVPVWSDDPWGSGVTRLVRAIYDDGVWAILGSIDGASTHLAETVVAKARVTLLGPAGTDKTVNMANVAWAFSCLPADDLLARALGGALLERTGGSPFGLISTTDHDSHAAVVELQKFFAARGASPRHHVEVEPGQRELSAALERAIHGTRAVVILAGPLDSARLLLALRESRAELTVLGGPALARRAFLERAGTAAEGVLFPLPCDPAYNTTPFTKEFRARFDRVPDCVTAQTYDAARLIVAAVKRAGLDRGRVRDEVQALAPWSGAAGEIRWDSHGQNRRKVGLATYREGRLVPVGDQAFAPTP